MAQAAYPLKDIPEMEGQSRTSPGGESVDEGHGHKKSMLNKMKDKAKTLKTKVKKKITPHHEANPEEDQEEDQEEDSYEATSEVTSEEEEAKHVEEHHQTEDKAVYDTDENVRGEYKNAEDNFQTGEQNTEVNKPSLGLGRVQQNQKQGEDEKPLTTEFGESNLGTDFDDNGRGGYNSVKKNFQTSPENTEPGKAWNQSSSEGVDRGKGSSEEFGVNNDTKLPEKLGEEQFQSPEGNANDNVKETPEKTELGKTWSERASEGFGFAKGKLQGYGVLTGTKSAQKPVEESERSPGNSQGKVSEIGEGKELGSDIRSTDSTEEIKTGPSETSPGYLKEDSIQADELKTVSSFDQTSSNDKSKDTVMEGEGEENENEGTQQQQSGEQKTVQNFGTKIFSAKDAISSKLGYGGQTNPEPNVIGETKPDDQIQSKEMDIDNESPHHTEETKTGPAETNSGYVKQASKLADEFKKVLSLGQNSSNNKAKDTAVEGEHKENEDGGKSGHEDGGKSGQSYVSKIYAAKDVVSSKLGYGGQSNQEQNPADQVERSATEPVEGAKEGKEPLKSTFVSKLSPGEDDKALSDVITGAVSNTAKSLKDSFGGLYGGNAKVSTPDTNMAANVTNDQNTASSPSGGKGIVDRVTGVVSSIFGSKQGDKNEQHSAPEKSEPKSQVQVEEQVPEVPKY